MNSFWTYAAHTAPSLLGLLIGQAVSAYAGWVGDAEIASVETTPVALPGRHQVSLVDTREIHPGPQTPSERTALSIRGADVLRHDGRVFLALAEAKTGGQRSTRVRISSSADEKVWTEELQWSQAGEFHGPRLLNFQGRLFAYVSVTHPLRGTSASYGAERRPDGSWSGWTDIGLAGHTISHTKWVDGVPLMTAYVGGSHLYRTSRDALEVRMLTTTDGWRWHPPSAGTQTVYRGGGSDTTFSSSGDGNLLAVVRNEAGDESGWGSSVCLAASGEWTNWDCVNDPKNYGAATTFTHDGEIYLIGRRQLGPDGNDAGFGGWWRAARHQVAALTTAKRCALWRFEPRERRFDFVLDLPSRGDTCAGAVMAGAAPGEFVVYTSSSDPRGPDLTLQAALERPNRLYRYELRWTSNNSRAHAVSSLRPTNGSRP